MLTATTTTHTTVIGKKLYYVRITDGVNEHLINIGERTYKRIEEIKKGGKTQEKNKK